MKKLSLIVVAVVLAVSMVVLARSAPAGAARKTINLDFATFWPAVDFQAAIGHKTWMKTLSDRVMDETTDYEIKWTEFYGVHPAKLLDGVEGGTYSVGTSGPGYSPGVFPLWAGPEYPGEAYRRNAYTMSLTIQALHEQMPVLQAQFDRTKMKLIHFWSNGPGYFLLGQGKTFERKLTGQMRRSGETSDVNSTQTDIVGAIGEAIGLQETWQIDEPLLEAAWEKSGKWLSFGMTSRSCTRSREPEACMCSAVS